MAGTVGDSGVKTDRKNARGIDQLLRMGWSWPVHCRHPATHVIRTPGLQNLTLRRPRPEAPLSIGYNHPL
jgi:hypothetical protein